VGGAVGVVLVRRWRFEGGGSSVDGVRVRRSLPQDHPLATHCELSALYCWILEILYCSPKGRRALLRIPTTGRAKCLPMLGEIKT